MKSISIIFSIILFIASPTNAQWVSFELNNLDADDFQEQITPLLQTISISSTRHFFSPTNQTGNIYLGISYSQGINCRGTKYSTERIGGYPNFYGALVITKNLILKGDISIFKSGNDLVQSFAYGFELKLTEKENNNWRLSTLFSTLQGPDDLKNRSLDAAIIKEFNIGSIHLFSGVGLNTYKTKILIEELEFVPKSVSGNAHHLLFGAQIAKGNLTLVPLMQINSDVVILSIEIAGFFK